MDLFESARAVHIGIGVVVLAAFWTAALAGKGGTWHRRGGRVYVWAMAALLTATGVMSVGMVKAGTPLRAVFDVYVSLISVASVWMAWSSVRHRHDIQRYLGWPYRALGLLLGGYALFLLALVPRMGIPARMAMVSAFAVLGLVVAGAMVWRWVRRDDHRQWWLSEHLTAMALNFAATHASFSILAGGAVFPALKEPWTRTAILVSWMLSALVVRVWAGRRFLGEGPVSHAGPASPQPRPLRSHQRRPT